MVIRSGENFTVYPLDIQRIKLGFKH